MIEYYTYWIVFNGYYDEYNAVLQYGSLNKMREDNVGTMHLFDKNLVTILSAVEYVMHMPRLELDLYDLDEGTIDAAYDESHNIFPIPDSIFINLTGSMQKVSPTLIIYADDCDKRVESISSLIEPTLGCYKVSQLTEKLLKEHWIRLSNRLKPDGYEKISNINDQYLLKDEYIKALPLFFLARQYKNIDEMLRHIYNTSNIEKTCIEVQWKQITKQNTYMEMYKRGICDIEIAEKVYNDIYIKQAEKFDINVVITFPGVSKQQIKYGVSATLPEDERRMIRIIGLHRAIARNGVLIELPCANEMIYKKINEIEIKCQQGANNRHIQKLLEDLGKILVSYFKDYQLKFLTRARHITIFSDLPLGLAVLENTEVPIQCYKSISYKPLSPLTRNFEIEMIKSSQIYLGKQCKIAFAECIIPDNENLYVRKMSEMVRDTLLDMQKEYSNMFFQYGETYTIKEIKEFINDNRNADILYISAHGHYARENNMAGLMIGNEFWMADENDIQVPPIVILSACHVSPRGSGAVNVADLFIRAGAIAVLGTFIPVNAKRNTILMTRLFTYILEAQKGSDQYKTLADAWSGIVSTNAIHELIQSSKRFERWIYGKNARGKVRMIEFQLERCVKRLHPATIYSDTIDIIKEMLAEEGMEEKFGNILDQRDFFPESYFYQFIGCPENVFLYNEIYSEAIERYEGKNF